MAPADHPETGTVADDNIRTVARIKEAAAELRTIAQRVSAPSALTKRPQLRLPVGGVLNAEGGLS